MSRSSVFLLASWLLLLLPPCHPWVQQVFHKRSPLHSLSKPLQAARITVPASELDADLTKDERSVVNVVRSAGPSVAYVTSVLPLETPRRGTTAGSETRRGQQSQSTSNSNNNSTNAETYALPRGRSLGSGSGFVVDADGYVVTNFHVIEAAYQLMEAAKTVENMIENFISNVTNATGLSYDLVDNSFFLKGIRRNSGRQLSALPQVYVRINTDTKFLKCKIVDVKPDIDIAVLKINSDKDSNGDNNKYSAVAFGSSSDLLVGQTTVAIGNPFGLDSTVTTGVVSALNRELSGRTRSGAPQFTPLKNCIQTDAAINPVSTAWVFLALSFHCFNLLNV